MNTTESDDLIECATCRGTGFVTDEDGDAGDKVPCDDCMGDGAVEDDGEPADIDSDEGFNPYTGSADDDGYDTGCFDDCDGNDF